MIPGVPAEERGALLEKLQPAEGTGELLIRTDYSWTSLASFAGPPWDRDGRTPVYWRYRYELLRGHYTLLLVAGPRVQLTVPDPLVSSLPPDLIPEITTIRAREADLVPDLGTPYRAEEIVGMPQWLINGYDPDATDQTDFEHYLGTFGIVPDVFKAQVVPRDNGVTIEHALNHWKLDISVPWDSPAAFAWEIVQPKGFDPFGGAKNYLLGAADFHLRLVCTSNVIVDGDTTYTIAGEAISHLQLDLATVALDEVPVQGADLSRGYLLRTVMDFPGRLSANSIQLLAGVEFALGFVPVVGSVISVAHLGYQAATGHTLWGETVTFRQLLLHGMFALLGCRADAPEAAEILQKISGRLYPGLKLVSLNPGPDPRFVAQIEEAANAYVLDAIERLSSEDYSKALQTLDDVAADVKPLTELGTLLDDVLYPTTVELEAGKVPDLLITQSLEWINPVNLEGFEAMPLPRQQVVIDAYRSILGGTQAPSLLFDRLEPELATQLTNRIDEWRVGRVLNVFFTGFRSASLRQAFARYVAGGGHYNAVQWAATRMDRANVQQLALALGSDFRSLLRQLDPDHVWNVTKDAAAHFAANGKVPDFYSTLSKDNRGFGLLFESDHGIEFRFFRRQLDLEDFQLAYAHVQALLVPKNPIVAAQLPADIVYYAHSVKTAMLARLIPHGFESAYTLQEVLDAYTLVYVHWLKVPLPIYQALVVDTFTGLAKELGVQLDLVIRTEGELLARNPSFRTMP